MNVTVWLTEVVIFVKNQMAQINLPSHAFIVIDRRPLAWSMRPNVVKYRHPILGRENSINRRLEGEYSISFQEVMERGEGGDVLLGDHYLVANLLGKFLPCYCRTRDIDLNAVAASMAIDPEKFKDPTTYMRQSTFADLLEALSFISSDKFFGLNYAAEYNIANLGLFGLGLLNAPTLYRAVMFYQRFVSLLIDHVQCDISLSEEKVSLHWRYSPFMTNKSQLVELEMILAIRLFRHFTGEAWKPSIAFLEREKPSDKKIETPSFAQRVVYKSGLNALCFPREILHSKNTSSDARVFELLERQCEQELKLISNSTPIASRVSNEILRRLPKGGFSLQDIAKSFSMSDRNFQRKLSCNGTSFEQLVEDTRRGLSDHLLKNFDLAIAEIAVQLGYSSPNAYSRAAKNWYQRPPSKVRNEHSLMDAACPSDLAIVQASLRYAS
jgi:AraC-like DNA-binding protein